MKATLRIAIISLLMLSVTVIANAQTTEKKALTIDGAKKVIAAAVAYAKKNNAPGGVIAVVDEGGNLMALERLDGGQPETPGHQLRGDSCHPALRVGDVRLLGGPCLVQVLRERTHRLQQFVV